MTSSRLCACLIALLVIVLIWSVVAFNLRALRSLEKRLVDATFGLPALRAAFTGGAEPTMCSNALQQNYVSAVYAKARWAAPLALRALAANDLMWNAATSTKDGKDQLASLTQPGDDGAWMALTGKGLPYFCSIGSWNGILLVVFRSTASESEVLQADLGGAFVEQYGYADVLRLMHAGLPVPCPPQVTLEGSKTGANDVPRVHAGFLSAYVDSGLEKQVWKELENRLTRSSKTPPLAILGHSLGAGVAAVCIARGIPRFQRLKLPSTYLILIACPKPGNAALRDFITKSGVECVCYANEADPVPWLPFSTMPDPDSKEGVLEYAMLPGTFLFSRTCPSLMLSHSSMTYRGLLADLVASKDEA